MKIYNIVVNRHLAGVAELLLGRSPKLDSAGRG